MPQFSAVTIAQRGAAQIEEINGERIELNPFPIVVLIRIPALEVAVRRFNILDREQVRARAEMAEQEDVEVLLALHAAATRTATKTTGQFNGTADARGNFLTKKTISDTVAQVSDLDAPVTSLVMRALDYKDIQNWEGTDFDPVTRKELLKTGQNGSYSNMNRKFDYKLEHPVKSSVRNSKIAA